VNTVNIEANYNPRDQLLQTAVWRHFRLAATFRHLGQCLVQCGVTPCTRATQTASAHLLLHVVVVGAGQQVAENELRHVYTLVLVNLHGDTISVVPHRDAVVLLQYGPSCIVRLLKKGWCTQKNLGLISTNLSRAEEAMVAQVTIFFERFATRDPPPGEAILSLHTEAETNFIIKGGLPAAARDLLTARVAQPKGIHTPLSQRCRAQWPQLAIREYVNICREFLHATPRCLPPPLPPAPCPS